MHQGAWVKHRYCQALVGSPARGACLPAYMQPCSNACLAAAPAAAASLATAAGRRYARTGPFRAQSLARAAALAAPVCVVQWKGGEAESGGAIPAPAGLPSRGCFTPLPPACSMPWPAGAGVAVAPRLPMGVSLLTQARGAAGGACARASPASCGAAASG